MIFFSNKDWTQGLCIEQYTQPFVNLKQGRAKFCYNCPNLDLNL